MDSPAHIIAYLDLLRDIDLLDNMNFGDRQSEMVLSFHEALGGIQSRLDHLRTIRSIPELVQAPPQDQAPLQPLGRTLPPDTREVSPMLSPGHTSPPVLPQPNINNRQTESDLSFRDALNEIQQRLDYLRTDASLRGILELVQANPQVRAPLRPLRFPPTLSTWEESPGRPSPVVSQDEMVIRQRGRRRLPVAWSPDIDLKNISSNSTDRTPPKIAPGRLPSQKSAVNLRSARRKRLTFL
ncbi:hypothetical protein MSG28_004559 [Choristoneura fumiferana]|uniref:Uncharacterized protein n=1 Tax=Choristoneura fumiferana TaxID=7141 RepID=A0ACC0K709_CHOFU|nr:hypothetical protein MSG28_004559 [Choristoneura fumiferana]